MLPHFSTCRLTNLFLPHLIAHQEKNNPCQKSLEVPLLRDLMAFTFKVFPLVKQLNFFSKQLTLRKKLKNTRASKRNKATKGNLLKEGAPLVQNRTYRIIRKTLRDQSPKKNMKSNKRPNIPSILPQISEHSTIPFIKELNQTLWAMLQLLVMHSLSSINGSWASGIYFQVYCVCFSLRSLVFHCFIPFNVSLEIPFFSVWLLVLFTPYGSFFLELSLSFHI